MAKSSIPGSLQQSLLSPPSGAAAQASRAPSMPAASRHSPSAAWHRPTHGGPACRGGPLRGVRVWRAPGEAKEGGRPGNELPQQETIVYQGLVICLEQPPPLSSSYSYFCPSLSGPRLTSPHYHSPSPHPLPPHSPLQQQTSQTGAKRAEQRTAEQSRAEDKKGEERSGLVPALVLWCVRRASQCSWEGREERHPLT